MYKTICARIDNLYNFADTNRAEELRLVHSNPIERLLSFIRAVIQL